MAAIAEAEEEAGVVLYRYAIHYLDASGKAQTHGGLGEPGVTASSAQEAADRALMHAGPQVKKTWARIEVIPEINGGWRKPELGLRSEFVCKR